LRKSYIDVLYFLVNNGTATKYEMEKGTKLSYSAVHGAVKGLIKDGLVEEIKDEGREKGPGPLPKRYFTLTLAGVCYALAKSKDLVKIEDYGPEYDLWKSIDSILARWKKLNPLFGKWHHIIAGVGRTEATRIFGCAISVNLMEWNGPKDLSHDFLECLFEEPDPPIETENWIKTIASDVKLRNYVVEWVTNELGTIQRT